MKPWSLRTATLASTVLALPALGVALPATAGAAAPSGVSSVAAARSAIGDPTTDPFYTYDGRRPLKNLKPGTVLKTRTIPYTVQGVPVPLDTTQVLYRTIDQLRRPAVNVTTVVKPVNPILDSPRIVSYGSFYDSLDPADQPSSSIAGSQGAGSGISNAETALITPFLLAGYTVNIPDTEGQKADFAAGPEYGYTTIDSLTAISQVASLGVETAPIGLYGYSGGAIASEWAAELVPSRAPAIAERVVGTAIGGVLVKPRTNLNYVHGSSIWTGVIPMALIGVSRAFEIDLRSYANDYGQQLFDDLQTAAIGDVLGRYPGLTWQQIAKPQYPVPETIPEYVRAANQLIMGRNTPTAPMFIGQGTLGELEGTPAGGPGIGPGDGVMVAGDVRTLARTYCSRGVKVSYAEYPLAHTAAAAPFAIQATPWLFSRFDGAAATDTCSIIPAGNSLAKIKLVR